MVDERQWRIATGANVRVLLVADQDVVDLESHEQMHELLDAHIPLSTAGAVVRACVCQ